MASGRLLVWLRKKVMGSSVSCHQYTDSGLHIQRMSAILRLVMLLAVRACV